VYRGQSGMWSWLLHRVGGIAILLFLLIHIVDITMLGFGRDVYNTALGIFATPVIRVVTLGLVFFVLYHSLNGVRITIIDFWPKGARYQRQLSIAVVLLTIAGFIGLGYAIMLPVFQGCPKGLCGN
jgi:succinate dehydrogenase / fumarate reductase, cytochrome b subunit